MDSSNTDQLISIEITPDNMKAYLEVDPPQEGQKWPTYADLMRKINEAGIIYGIKEVVVKRIVQEKITSSILIAEGKPAQRGIDAKIKYLFETDRLQLIPKELEGGRVDHRELSLIQNVKKGQAVAERTPPTPGIPGYNIKGDEIAPTPGKDVLISLGKNVAWDEKKLLLRATNDGEPNLVGKRISVQTLHQVNSNVGYGTGNIDFNGSVYVRGDVENGFTVKATGDVVVTGNIDGGLVYADGNITINGGIVGQDKSVIKCNGDLVARYIDHAQVDVGGDIKVRDTILHSQVNSGRKVILGGRKGIMMGGIVRAEDEIDAQIIGSRMGTITEIEVGTNPAYKQELNKIEKRLSEMEKEEEKIEKALAILNREGYELTPEREELRARLTRTGFVLKGEKRKLENRRDELNKEIEERGADKGRVKVRQTIYPGVRVTIGKAIRIFHDEIHFAVLAYNEGEVEIQAYR